MTPYLDTFHAVSEYASTWGSFIQKVHVRIREQVRIWDCCNIQDGALCDNSQRLPAVNYYHKALHVGSCSNPRSASGESEM